MTDYESLGKNRPAAVTPEAIARQSTPISWPETIDFIGPLSIRETRTLDTSALPASLRDSSDFKEFLAAQGEIRLREYQVDAKSQALHGDDARSITPENLKRANALQGGGELRVTDEGVPILSMWPNADPSAYAHELRHFVRLWRELKARGMRRTQASGLLSRMFSESRSIEAEERAAIVAQRQFLGGENKARGAVPAGRGQNHFMDSENFALHAVYPESQSLRWSLLQFKSANENAKAAHLTDFQQTLTRAIQKTEAIRRAKLRTIEKAAEDPRITETMTAWADLVRQEDYFPTIIGNDLKLSPNDMQWMKAQYQTLRRQLAAPGPQ